MQVAVLEQTSQDAGENAGIYYQISTTRSTVEGVLTLEETIAVGVRWLLTSEQPEGAVLQHHHPHAPPVDGLVLGFCPEGKGWKCVVVAERHKPRWDDSSVSGSDLLNPITADEVERVRFAINAAGGEIADEWNGAGFIVASFGLVQSASPTLIAAMARYRDGCPEHHSVFCGDSYTVSTDTCEACRWYANGNALVVRPRFLQEVGLATISKDQT